MPGQMMQMPLLISSILQHAERVSPNTLITTRTVEGPFHQYSYRDAAQRIRKLANTLIEMGIKPGDRIATLAWNTYRHFELYYAISGIGAVLHTINPRLHPEQIAYIVNHAEDRILFFDLTFTPIIEGVQDHLKTVEHFVAMTDDGHAPDAKIRDLSIYETMIAPASDQFDWPQFDENTASSLCYTSGTTGNPKGVLYSHRSTVLHAMAANMGNACAFTARDAVMPIVPMFHVNAWGTPYAAPMAGAQLVMPGPGLDGKNLHELIERTDTSVILGVPTVMLGLLNHLQESGGRVDCLDRLVVGGSAVPQAQIEAYEGTYDVKVVHAWGMTELSPLGSFVVMQREFDDLAADEQMRIKLKQGKCMFGVEMRAVDDDGNELPADGESAGHLQIRSPWSTNGYFKGKGQSAFTEDGWFTTGDVANLDEFGFMAITDRSKDVIKSGGEWISSIDLENAAVSHPGVAMAAVIAIPHPKWDERPLLVVVKAPGQDPSPEEILEFLKPKVAKWWLPDAVEFVDEIPLGATGKILKTALRDQFAGYQLAAE
ncbi:MAG: long-chain-fatty-acid--CoA ligase [Alphaproteobacteria bacterium]|nr:long-chain-fatty-acid--CoA ligase [Alphaproteobacteria bacterium SS10]